MTKSEISEIKKNRITDRAIMRAIVIAEEVIGNKECERIGLTTTLKILKAIELGLKENL